jgi:hypothetical protein
MKLTEPQARVLVSIVEGAGTTQRFGRWSRQVTDALKRRGLITVREVELTTELSGSVYALWRVDLTAEGRQIRDRLIPNTQQYPFPAYPTLPKEQMCLHDPLYPIGGWRCLLRQGHATFHRYAPARAYVNELNLPNE